MPPLADRFELLEDTLRFVRDGWTGEHGTEAAFEGARVQRDAGCSTAPRRSAGRIRPSWSAAAASCKTLRLVARYADACNVFGAPEQVAHKYAVLRGHCETEGRDYDAIEKTNLTWVAITPDGGPGSLTPIAAGGPAGCVGGRRLACTPSSASATCGTWPSWSSSAGTCCPQVRGLGEPSPLDPIGWYA